MNIRALIFALVGLLIAGGSVWVAMGSKLASPATAAIGTETVLVISARHDIQFGEEITLGMLAMQSWPADTLPEGVFNTPEQLVGPEGSDIRRARETIRTGELLNSGNISEFGETVTIVKALGSNTRAVAIRVDSVTAVGGFVTPGDRVDIVMTEGEGAGLRAATILQDIRVLGVDQNTDTGNRATQAARTITVEVTPRDGQILALAQKAGTLSLTLRTEIDVSNAELGQISLEDLLQNAQPVIVKQPDAPIEPKRTIKVRRGTDTAIVEVN
ncbi:MAG: Flp pilus assembly protein CpaB [Roseovarius sp.]